MFPPALSLNAHPQPVAFVTWQQLPPGSEVPHWAPEQPEEQCPFVVPPGHTTIVHPVLEPATLQLVASQQQQQPATAPPPFVTPQASVEKSAHCLFVGDAAAAADGTAIE
jgi:hypothetical protein